MIRTNIKIYIMGDVMTDKFYVIIPIFNPGPYKTRNKLYHEFVERFKQYDIEMITVEGSVNDFVNTDSFNPNHIQVHYDSIFWCKENLINIGIEHVRMIDPSYKYVAWIDCDLAFSNPSWVEDAKRALDKYNVVQLFDEVIDLDKNGNALLKSKQSFVAYYEQTGRTTNGYWYNYAPGFAWAYSRNFLESINLFDESLIWASDTIMSRELIHQKNNGFSTGVINRAEKWGEKARPLVSSGLGYVKNTIQHYWHGSRKNRSYESRGKILIKYNYDPEKDSVKDGMILNLCLHSERQKEFQNEIIQYFLSRKEDE
jgi:hypothetical protein